MGSKQRQRRRREGKAWWTQVGGPPVHPVKGLPCLLPLPLHLAFKGPSPDLCFLKRSSCRSSCTRLSGRSAQGKNSDHDLGQTAHAAAVDAANAVVRCGLRVRLSGVPQLRAWGAGGRRGVACRRLCRGRRLFQERGATVRGLHP